MSGFAPSAYIHGNDPVEQDRLLRLNRLINPACLQRLRLLGGERVLDVGSGPGVFARQMAEVVESRPVVCVERDDTQIERCRELADAAGEADRIEVRQGEVEDLPLADAEWGSFDVVHCRFLLEHLDRPQAAVEAMARALRPGGRLVLLDDDHDLLRMWPSMPAVDELWRGLIRAFQDLGNDPFVGRKLVAMLRLAELTPVQNDVLFFGGCAGDERWDLVVDNLVGVLNGAKERIVETVAMSTEVVDDILEGVQSWRRRSDSALWYQICWAEGTRPA